MNYYACPDCGRTEGHMHALRCGARDTMVVSPQTVEFVDGFAKKWSKPHPVNIRGQDRNRLARKKLKPLSPRRAREFRDRFLKRHFGDRKTRAERFAWLEYTYGPGAALYGTGVIFIESTPK